MRHIILITLFLFISAGVFSQNIGVNVPDVVVQNQQFEITFVLNSKNIENATLEYDQNELIVLNKRNPQRSESTSITEINGNYTKATEVSLTYKLKPKLKEGTIKSPKLSATVNGTMSYSTSKEIKVVNASSLEKREDYRAALILSSKNIFEGESARAELKLYFSKNLKRVDVQDKLAAPGLKIKQLEQNGYEQTQGLLDGKLYNEVLIARYELTADTSGTYTLPPLELSVVVQEKSNAFGGFQTYRNKSIPIFTEDKILQVIPVGNIPENYLGVFSDLSYSMKVPSTEISTAEAFEIKFTLNGKGNFSNIKTPELNNFTKYFNVFTPELTPDYKFNSTGEEGSLTLNYTLAPKASGEVNIRPYYLTYFNSTVQRFDSISVPPLTIQITEGGTTKTLKSDLIDEDFNPYPVLKATNPSPAIFNRNKLLSILGIMIFVFGLAKLVVFLKKTVSNRRIKNAPVITPKEKALKALSTVSVSEEPVAFADNLLDILQGYFLEAYKLPISKQTEEHFKINGLSHFHINGTKKALNGLKFGQQNVSTEHKKKLITEVENIIEFQNEG